jgi:hypothetical protein
MSYCSLTMDRGSEKRCSQEPRWWYQCEYVAARRHLLLLPE